MFMTAMQIFCYLALLLAVAGTVVPYRPFHDRSAAALVALIAFVALGLSTPLREPPKNLSYFEWQVAKQKCLETKQNIGPCRVSPPRVAASTLHTHPE